MSQLKITYECQGQKITLPLTGRAMPGQTAVTSVSTFQAQMWQDSDSAYVTIFHCHICKKSHNFHFKFG